MRFMLASFGLGLVLSLSACGGSNSSDPTSTGGNTSTGGDTGAGGTQGDTGLGGSHAAGGLPPAGGGASAGANTVDPPGSSDCTDSATASGTFAIRYDAAEIPVVGRSKSYFIHTNWWYRYASQTVTYQGLSFTVGDPANTSVPATDGNPTGYPSLFIGSYSGNTTAGSNLPKQVSALTRVPTVLATNSLEHDISHFNAAYDVWLTASGSPLSSTTFTPGAGGAYLMVWLFKPASRQPRGGSGNNPNYAARSIDGVSGSWDVWVDPSNPPCITYVSATPLDSLAFDLNRFIRDSVTNRYGITDSMYLSIVFAGFEIWGGGDGLQVENFCAQVE